MTQTPRTAQVTPAGEAADPPPEWSEGAPELGPERAAALQSGDVFAALGSTPQGLSSDEAARRLTEWGENALVKERGRPLWLEFAANFYHLFAIMLWVAAGLSFVARLPELAWAIIVVIVINALFSFWQEYRAEKATEALERLIPQRSRVLREGAIVEVLAAEVVPGDVLVLEEGDNVPADARVIEEFDLRVDQSVLNGEAAPANRSSTPMPRGRLSTPSEATDLVFAGTSVVYGRGRAVAYATGMRTEFGRIASLTQSVTKQLSPLQRQVQRVTRLVAVLAVLLGVVFFVLGTVVANLPVAEGLIFAIGIIVANVPEGLLPTLTLSLAMGVQRMAARSALVKRLSAVETLGSTTVICTDKTGTLTENEMTVRRLYVPDAIADVSGTGYTPRGEIEGAGGPLPDGERSLVEGLLTTAALCTDARLVPPDAEHPGWHLVGDPTEGALIVAAAKVNVDRSEAEGRTPRLAEVPFDAERKRMSTVHEQKDGLSVEVKGAPKELLALCSRVRTTAGEFVLDDATRTRILEVNDAFAREGLRVLAVATRSITTRTTRYEAEDLEHDLTFLGLAAMMDPPRPEVSAAVEACRTAGIRIVMITGDYGLTADSIARRVGIVSGPDGRIVTGADLDAMDDAALSAVLQSEESTIFARVSPQHKMRVAQVLHGLGEVTAMTGDGVNDAPALKTADIGVAMGVSGTDVAREAADMILADDNFASIVSAVEEGRAVFDNIRRFVTYIFTSNVPEIVPFVLFVIFGIPLPLTILQILAIDLGTDIVPALALGVERPEAGTMQRPPRSQRERLLNARVLARAYLFLGPLQASAAMFGYFYAYWSRGWRPPEALPGSGPLYALATTMCFAAIVATQVGNGFAQRTNRESVFSVGLFSNRLLLLGIASEIGLLAAFVYVPFLRDIFGFAPLAAGDWLVLVALSPLLLVADEARKAIVRRRTSRQGAGVSAGRKV